MTDLAGLIQLSEAVATDATEPNLECFLQAYNATTKPVNVVESILFEMLGDVTMDMYLHPCTCEHEEADNA